MTESAEPDEFPVDKPEDAKPGRPVKGSAEALAWAQKMKDARAAKREARGDTGSTRSSGRTKATPRASRPDAPLASLNEIESSLTEGFTKLGAMLVMPAPIPGTYMIQTSDQVAGSLTRLAAKNPALLRALSSTSNIMDYVAVGTWAVGLYVAVSVQTGRIPADSQASRGFGLLEIAEEFYPPGSEPVEVSEAPVSGNGSGAFDRFAVPVPPDIVEAEERASVG